MSIDTPAIPPIEGTQPKKKNKLLWGCLIGLILTMVVLCVGTALIMTPIFSDRDPLGLRDWIEEYIPFDYLEDPSSIPPIDDQIEPESYRDLEDFDSRLDTNGVQEARDIPLQVFHLSDVGISFSYPVGWEIELEDNAVTFYAPEEIVFIYLGEEWVESGSRSKDLSAEVMASIEEDALEGSFRLIASIAYPVPIAEDSHLVLYEWIDLTGDYIWAYELEIVSGESNIFIFLVGDDEDKITYYGDLLDIIASSLVWVEEE